jgi:hypothetical protein
MQARILQVQPEPWPSGYGEAMAVLDLDLQALAGRHGFVLYEGTDNLDDYQAVALQLPSGRRVGLLRHAGAPSGESEMYADAHDDPDSATRELLDALELPSGTCRWLRQSVPASAGSPTAGR